MNNPPIIKDERTRSIEDASYRVGFNIICFGLLIDLVFRSVLYPNESVWDLMALVVISGFASTIYQARHKTLPPNFLRSMLILSVATALLSAALVLVILKFRKIW
jgi:hypothetical protein